MDRYGGEYEFDRFDVKLWNRRGADRGVSIRYGKNLRTLEQDENCDNCYTGVYPYWCSAEGNLVQLPEKVVYASGTYDHVEILDLDFSEEWETAPTEEQLRARAERYITDNDIGIPNVSWKIEHVALEQTEEYKGMALLERVLLGDTDTVEFPEMNVYASSRVVATDFDVLLERYNSITLGKVKANIASTIAQQNKEIQNKPSQTMVMAITRTLTERITGAKGGIVRIMDTDGDGWPDELYVADNPDPAQAVKVWRFNYEGWAGSKAGYNGPFNLGATLEDGLLADFVRAAHLVAGTIQSADDGETFFLDLSNSILKMKAMDDLQTKVDENQTTTEKRISEVSVKADGVFAEVSQQTQTVENIKEEVAAIQAVAGEVAIRVQSIEDNGVSKVKTQMGYTFDDEGMHVEKEGDEVGSKVNNRGIYVSRGSEVMLQADASGVKATDVTVNNYLIIGHTRYEEFDDGIDSDCTAAFDI